MKQQQDLVWYSEVHEVFFRTCSTYEETFLPFLISDAKMFRGVDDIV